MFENGESYATRNPRGSVKMKHTCTAINLLNNNIFSVQEQNIKRGFLHRVQSYNSGVAKSYNLIERFFLNKIDLSVSHLLVFFPERLPPTKKNDVMYTTSTRKEKKENHLIFMCRNNTYTHAGKCTKHRKYVIQLEVARCCGLDFGQKNTN